MYLNFLFFKGFGGGLFGKTTAASTGFSLTGASSAAPTLQLGGGLASNTTGFGLNTTTTAASTDRFNFLL